MLSLKTISLYSGIGGLDFGFEAAGFETRVAVEFDKFSCKTLRLNRPTWEIIEDDINSVSSDTIMQRGGLRPGEADVLIGGPPCQPFSKSSYWVRGDSLRLDDPRSDTLSAYLRVLRDTLPKSFLLENVGGLAFKNKDEGMRLLISGIEEINRQTGAKYRPAWKLLRTADYGVPQLRERVFLVGSRDGRDFEFPSPTHSSVDDGGLIDGGARRYSTAWDVLGDLTEPNSREGLEVGGKWGDLLPTIPEGKNYLWHTNRGGGQPLFGWRTRYWSFLLKLAKGAPSWTIQAQPGSSIGPFHWNNRKLTFEELCRLQTFPDGLLMHEGRTEMQRMLGNAVPSLMAEVLARAIRTQFLDAPILDPIRLLRSPRNDMPPAEPIAPVPAHYLSMIGNHDDHPGTGKGKGAKGEETAFKTKPRLPASDRDQKDLLAEQ